MRATRVQFQQRGDVTVCDEGGGTTATTDAGCGSSPSRPAGSASEAIAQLQLRSCTHEDSIDSFFFLIPPSPRIPESRVVLFLASS